MNARTMLVVGLIGGTACMPENPDVSPPKPSKRKIERLVVEKRVKCSRDYYALGLETLAEIHDTQSTPEDVAAEMGGGDPKYQRACREAFEDAIDETLAAQAAGWPPWGSRDAWTAHHQTYWLCYELVYEERLFGAAEFVGVTDVSPEAIAKQFHDGDPPADDASESGCLRGVEDALANHPHTRPSPG